ACSPPRTANFRESCSNGIEPGPSENSKHVRPRGGKIRPGQFGLFLRNSPSLAFARRPRGETATGGKGSRLRDRNRRPGDQVQVELPPGPSDRHRFLPGNAQSRAPEGEKSSGRCAVP